MGVHSLWDIVSPTAKPVRLESLNERKFAVDASIWIYQFLKAMRSKEGDALRNAHIIGFFRRICKLLYYGIKPVFVFDGGVPILKINTIRERKERREGKRDNVNTTAKKLLARQIHQLQNESPNKRKSGTPVDEANPEGELFYPHDEYHLPDIRGFKYEKDDLRITDTEDYKTVMDQIDDLDGIDLDTINPASKEFDELPKSTQYLIISALRLKSRLRLGYTKEQLESVFPNSMDFSKFQIEMVKRRNFFTQKLMGVTGMHDGGASKLDVEASNRVAGQRGRQYALLKTDTGWALSLGGNDGSEAKKAISLDEDDDADDMEWEEVDTKPKPKVEKLDYSISASLLPKLSNTKTTGGSQSFFDKRSDLVPKTSHLLDDSGDSQDDYEDVLQESNAIEEYQRSRMENVSHSPRNGHIDVLRESTNESIGETAHAGRSENLTVQKRITSPSKIYNDKPLTLIQDLTSEKLFEGDKPENETLQGNNNPSSVPTLDNEETKQTLDKIVSKISPMSFSFNATGKAFEDLKELEPETSHEKPQKPVLDVPAWFQASTETNPYKIQSFVPDTEKQTPTENEKYGILTGEAAKELVDNRSHHYQEVIDLDKLDQELDNAIDKESPKKVDDITLISSNRPSSGHESEDDSGSDSGILREQLPIMDYDFYEDEEENLAEQLSREQADYNNFKSVLNPNVMNRAFIEDELFKQQKKDKRDADEVTVDMIREIQSLLSRFGIPYITAPMEAEAQCAALLQAKLVDGIITDDSDVFLFGGTHVYKNMFQEKNYVEYYSLDLLDQKLGLNRDMLIQLAQLLGSDYTTGLKGIGPVMGVEILAEFGSLKEFAKWYNEGQFNKQKLESETTFQKQLRKRLVSNEVVLDETFPSFAVHDAYIHPTVDNDTTKFVWGSPDLDKLRVFLRQTIGWDKAKSDEVLVPLIRDLNKRKKTGVQKRINEFFPVQYLQQDKQFKLGKRIETATSKLKKQKLK